EQSERNGNSPSSLHEEWNADLDYVLALSLQNENNPHNDAAAGIPSDFWETHYTKEPLYRWYITVTYFADDEVIMLPCEFCEEPYPDEDLILHQTGCNPASAFASFSKRSSSRKPREYDGLRDTGSKSFRSFSSSQPQAVQAEENIMIPCEFCGIQLEEETVFHHQHHCDLRPASPAASGPAQQLPSPRDNRERSEAPELARRQLGHQGV
ncbi:TRAD1 protein, partial [Nyctibius bracteatus]|nr:TRAD1 protein [Nyctibius bracteatus]